MISCVFVLCSLELLLQNIFGHHSTKERDYRFIRNWDRERSQIYGKFERRKYAEKKEK